MPTDSTSRRTAQAPAASDLPRGIGRPATSALAVEGVTRLDQVTRFSERELLALHGVGPKAVGILKEELAARGLSLAPAKQK
ncbi:DNA-binding protein [Myxococcus sp. Y35]|uniref:DNA-binding protein n=1 Tax=Pseudomyxococcus flavus TaxID=3115648 RepID=UPI003CEFB525